MSVYYILLAWAVLACVGAFVSEDSWWHRFALATDVFFAATWATTASTFTVIPMV